MLHELPTYAAMVDRPVRIEDITMVIAVRLHDANPWVLERLEMQATWYEPRPSIQVVDFGSVGAHRERIAEMCQEHGLDLLQIDDHGTYSAARARNLGFTATKTRFVYFNDVDCFSDTGHFSHLARVADTLRLGSLPDQMINLPVVHLGADATKEFMQHAPRQRGSALRRVSLDALADDFGGIAEFVAPYSNIFLCHRHFFELVGGYDETFRGHGSEDFEFLLRFVQYAGGLPVPDDLGEDLFGPTRPNFFESPPYRGFRRLFEGLAYSAHAEGLRTVHLHHSKPPQAKWYESGDRYRKRFSAVISTYLDTPRTLIERDWLPRASRCLVFLGDGEDASIFTALRLGGFQLELFPKEESTQEHTIRRIVNQEFHAVAIIESPTRSREQWQSHFDLAVENGATPIVISRGVLPGSWCYDTKISSLGSDFAIGDLQVSRDEIVVAREYRKMMCGKPADPEPSGRLRVLIVLNKHSYSVSETYRNFESEVLSGLPAHQQVCFFIAGSAGLQVEAPNASLTPQGMELSSLIRSVESVICHDSHVVLLALLHGKQVVTFGDPFCNFDGVVQVRTMAEAVRSASEPSTQSRIDIDRLTAWLLFHKYSFFGVEDLVGGPSAVAIRIYRLFAPRANFKWRRACISRPLRSRSYTAARLHMHLEGELIVPDHSRRERAGRRFRKLVRDPKRFLADSRYMILRELSKALFK